MRLHTDTLTIDDLVAALPPGVFMYCTTKGSRKRKVAYEVTLYVFFKDELHLRLGNSGCYGSSTDVAATWDEWGVWVHALYSLDESAIIGWYENPLHFFEITSREREYVTMAHKPESLAARTHTAPWLEG